MIFKHSFSLLFIAILFSLVVSCKEKENDTAGDPAQRNARLLFKFRFDSTQVRLDNFGNPSSLPAGHGAQSPRFNKMSAHYIELSPSANTPLGAGKVLYKSYDTNAGGSQAINFEMAKLAVQNEIFFSIPLDSIIGTYSYLRISLAYQNYDIDFRYTFSGTDYDFKATLASFIGYNTYIKKYVIKDSTITLNANKLQGYWGLEIHDPGLPFSLPQYVYTGQAPAGATTVPNPINSTSPIPAGSCVVTGAFSSPLTITGNETKDIAITVSLSTNKSFEWIENSTDGFYEPAAGDTVVDMGIRGLIPMVN